MTNLDPRTLCRFVRWKSAALGAAEGPDLDELAESLRRRSVPFSCLRTCQAWGPDDGPGCGCEQPSSSGRAPAALLGFLFGAAAWVRRRGRAR